MIEKWFAAIAVAFLIPASTGFDWLGVGKPSVHREEEVLPGFSATLLSFTIITITMTIIMIMIIIISMTMTKPKGPRLQDLYLGSSLDDVASLQFSLSLHLLLRIRSPFQYGALKPTNKQTSKHTYKNDRPGDDGTLRSV